jgi:hypothetical protein
MKAKLHPRLKLARIRHPWSSYADDQNGAFRLMGPCKRPLLMIASNGGGWDHISVSIADNEEIPTWDEMCFVKDLFFEAEEPAFQYHPPQSRYVNIFKGCLHLWRPQGVAIPMPDLGLV